MASMQRRGKKSEMTHVGDVLKRLISSFQRDSETLIHQIREHFDTLFAPGITAHARPAELKNGILHIHVKSSTVTHQLRFHSVKIMDALNQVLEGAPIREIRFKVGPF